MLVKIFRTVVALICVILAEGAYCSAYYVDDERSSLILVSVDGLSPDYILEADRLNLKIPNLRQLLKQGTYSTGVRVGLPSLTYPSHVTLITGVSPGVHGITNNILLDPFNLHRKAWFWFTKEIKVKTLWDLAYEANLVTANVEWPVSVGANITHNIPQFWNDSTENDRNYIRNFATKGLLDEVDSAIGPYPIADWSIKGDRQRIATLLHLLRTKNPHLVTSYLGAIDHTSHKYGVHSTQAHESIEDLDGLLGKLINESLLINPKRVLCIVSDHGFMPVHTQIHLNALLKDAGLIKTDENNKVLAWDAYAWEGQGVAAIVLADKNNFELKNKIEDLLLKLKEANPEAISQVWGESALSSHKAFPEASFLVVAREGYQMTDHLEAPVVGQKTTYKATHGFLPDLGKMEASFYIVGSNIKQANNIGKISMTQIAPTLASILGLDFPYTEGSKIDLSY